MIVALYRNKETDAARIVCAVDHVKSWVSDHRGGGPSQGSIKVTALTIRRESKYVLVLARSRHLWARLVFSDFESMTIALYVNGELLTFRASRYDFLL